MSPEPPTPPPKYVEQNLHFPQANDPQAPIQAETAGIYVLTVSVNVDGGKPYEANRSIAIEQ